MFSNLVSNYLFKVNNKYDINAINVFKVSNKDIDVMRNIEGIH